MKSFKTFIWGILIIVALVYLIPSIFFAIKVEGSISTHGKDYADFGNYIGGIVNPLLIVVNIAALGYITYYVEQRQDERIYKDRLFSYGVQKLNQLSRKYVDFKLPVKRFSSNHPTDISKGSHNHNRLKDVVEEIDMIIKIVQTNSPEYNTLVNIKNNLKKLPTIAKENWDDINAQRKGIEDLINTIDTQFKELSLYFFQPPIN